MQHQLREEGGTLACGEVSSSRSSCRRKRAATVSGGLQLRRLRQETSPGEGLAAAGQDNQHEELRDGQMQECQEELP